MKKLFKRVSILFAALMALSVSTVRTVEEVKAAGKLVATFVLGTDGDASHSDNNNAKTTYDETADGYTLSITNGVKMYPGSRDATGKSCIKLGTSSSAGSFDITIPDDVTSVEIDAATYKDKTAKVSVNSVATALTSKSNTGNYDTLTADTTTTKTVSFKVTSGYRCMVNEIRFYVVESGEDSGEQPDTPTDESLVASALSSYSVNTFYSASGDYELPTSSDDIQFTYEVTTDNATDFAVDEDGLLSVNPTNSLKKATLTVTATLNDASDSKDIEIASLLKDSELTIANAIEAAKHFGTTESTDRYYVSGTITEIKSKTYGNVIIQDGTGSMLVYGLYKDGVRYDKMDIEPIVGDEIQVYGQLINFNGDTPEVTGDPELIKHKENTSRIDRISGFNTEFSLSFDYSITTGFENEGNDVATIADVESKLDFSTTDQRLLQTTTQQVWSNGVVTLTNDKASSTTNIVDSSAPVKLYASSKVTIEVVGYNIGSIEFNTNATKYATALLTSLGDEAVSNGLVVTYTPESKTSTLVIEKLSAQVRLDSLVVNCIPAKQEVITNQAYANIDITFGATVNAALFEGYTIKGAGLLIGNAANYTETSIAESFNGDFKSFNGIYTDIYQEKDAEGNSKALSTVEKEVDGQVETCYVVGSTIEVISGQLTDENKKYLDYKFAAAAYFTLEDDKGNSTTVVLNQKEYSVRTMLEEYTTMDLDAGTKKVVNAFAAFIA